ncbi:MAG: hypothetical protein CMI18_03170 [Opitutaceae bacterium]|nr:hypothetical protein [Opitutaceae bacterium]
MVYGYFQRTPMDGLKRKVHQHASQPFEFKVFIGNLTDFKKRQFWRFNHQPVWAESNNAALRPHGQYRGNQPEYASVAGLPILKAQVSMYKIILFGKPGVIENMNFVLTAEQGSIRIDDHGCIVVHAAISLFRKGND